MQLYHVSSKYLGEEVTLIPRIPPSQSLQERQGKYRDVPRICCSDTIEQCLRGITKLHLEKRMYVYRTVGKIDVDWDSPRQACDDWEVTDEAWLHEPTRFKLVCVIEPNTDVAEDEFSYKKVKLREGVR